MKRRDFLGVIGGAVVAWPFKSHGQKASQWPDRPVRLLVTVGAGGAADTLSRNLSQGFSQIANGQPLVIENRPGAGGAIAAAAVAREKPDGYTLFLAEVGPNAVSHVLGAKLPYDPHTAFTPIIHVANLPAVLLIRPTLPFTTLADFIAAAKLQPGKFNYASAGPGNWTHLFMAYLNSQAGIDQVNVAYRSGSEMLTSLLRNGSILRSSRSRPLSAKSAKVRFARLPAFLRDQCSNSAYVPPVSKTIPGFDVAVWHGIAGPADIEPALVSRINEIFNRVLQLPSVHTAISDAQSADIIGGTPQQFDAFIKSELKRWPDVVKAAGMKSE